MWLHMDNKSTFAHNSPQTTLCDDHDDDDDTGVGGVATVAHGDGNTLDRDRAYVMS